jgi:hypothetical protein
LDPRKAYEYLGIEDSHDTEHKNEKEKLKKEYLRRLRIVLDTELNARNKIQAIGALAAQVLRYTFGITDTKKNCKNWIRNKKTANHPQTASPTGRCRLLVCFQKTQRKGAVAITRSLHNKNYKTHGICRQY